MKLRIICTVFILLILFGSQSPLISMSDPTYTTNNNSMKTEIISMINQISHDQIYSYHENLLSYGIRYTGTTNCSQASTYLYDTFSSLGLNTKTQKWSINGFESENVIATIYGKNPDNVTYILCAHYDTSPESIGADDDGSGVAALLGIADVMAKNVYENTIKFIAFSGEEVGTYGSFIYARDAYRNKEDIKAVLNLDMIGFSNTEKGSRTLRFHCPKRSEWIAETADQIADMYNSILDMEIEMRPNYIGADHQAFVDYGYDGVWIAHADGYPYAHTPNDRPEQMNWTYQLKATKLICAILAEMADYPLPLHIQLIKPHEGTLYFKDNRIPCLNLGRFWAKQLRGITILFGPVTTEAYVKSTHAIEYVVFCLDNNFMFYDPSPPYQWNIQGRHKPPIGSYTLRVYAFDKQGGYASDEMNIFSISTQYHYRPW